MKTKLAGQVYCPAFFLDFEKLIVLACLLILGIR